MLNADWLGAPRLRTSRTIGARGIKLGARLVRQVTSFIIRLLRKQFFWLNTKV